MKFINSKPKSSQTKNEGTPHHTLLQHLFLINHASNYLSLYLSFYIRFPLLYLISFFYYDSMMKKVLIGLSGGLDSAVAAKLLQNDGFLISSCTLLLLDTLHCDTTGEVCAVERAKAISSTLGIQHTVYDCRKEFKTRVIDYFVHTYKIGHTPNPCYRCNKEIKFGLMLDIAKREGFDFLATGHYAIVQKEEGERVHLLKAQDASKDQSYFLSGLSKAQLAYVLFPLGSHTKNQARELAQSYDLFNEQISESQDICFAADGDYAKAIDSFCERDDFPTGSFVDAKGRVLGQHKGIQHYTIGQRRGLAIALGYPTYVLQKDARNNTVTIGKKEQLLCHSLIARELNIIEDLPLNECIAVQVRTRYRQTERQAFLTLRQYDGELEALVEFAEPETAVATGQVAVFYNALVCLGSGIIKETFS